MIPCPRCNGPVIKQNGFVHCLTCCRDFRLVPVLSDKRRTELVVASRANDYKLRNMNSNFAGARLPVFSDV